MHQVRKTSEKTDKQIQYLEKSIIPNYSNLWSPSTVRKPPASSDKTLSFTCNPDTKRMKTVNHTEIHCLL